MKQPRISVPFLRGLLKFLAEKIQVKIDNYQASQSRSK